MVTGYAVGMAADSRSSAASSAALPLFPLHTVLFPGGTLALRIFEPRYLDMLRDCGRGGHGFGICLILAGEEVGRPATPAAFGTEARIVDFSGDAAVLALQVEGRRRFHVQRTRVRDSGLVMAEVQWLPADAVRLRPEHALLADLLQRAMDEAGHPLRKAEKACFDDADWVAWRLAELLPQSDAPRQQRLLQIDDPHARLDQLLRWLS